MAPFSEKDTDQLDWELFRDGAVTQYWRHAIFDRHCAWLTDHDYRVHVIDCMDENKFRGEMNRVLLQDWQPPAPKLRSREVEATVATPPMDDSPETKRETVTGPKPIPKNSVDGNGQPAVKSEDGEPAIPKPSSASGMSDPTG